MLSSNQPMELTETLGELAIGGVEDLLGRGGVAGELRFGGGFVADAAIFDEVENGLEAVAGGAVQQLFVGAADGVNEVAGGVVFRAIARVAAIHHLSDGFASAIGAVAAIAELHVGDDNEVAIDQAVSLAKRYASEDAGRLVNGILGRVAREASQT